MTFLRLLLVAIVTAPMGCDQPLPTPLSPIIVRDVDLMSVYRDDPNRAELAYDHQRIRLLVQFHVAIDATTVGVPIIAGKPPLIILKFAVPPIPNRTPFWVVGTCHGRTDDGVERLLPGCEFHIDVTECVVTGPP